MFNNIKKKINKLRKSAAEFNYWKNKKAEEKVLNNQHFEFFYTSLFKIDKSFYAGKKILDIGCGPRGSLEWADNTEERVGLDPLVGEYKKLGIDNHKMKYTKSGSENIPYNNTYFDAIFSFNSLDHVDDLDKTIKEIKRVIKIGGIFLLITEINHKPSVCEPQVFSEDIEKKFMPEFMVVEKQMFPKEGGIYQSILSGKEYLDNRRPGVLVVKFINKS